MLQYAQAVLIPIALGVIISYAQEPIVARLTRWHVPRPLASGDLYRRRLVKIAGPSLTEKKVTVRILTEIDQQIARFLLVQIFTSSASRLLR